MESPLSKYFFFFFTSPFFFTKPPDKMQIGWKVFRRLSRICSRLRYTRCFKNIISFLQSEEEIYTNYYLILE